MPAERQEANINEFPRFIRHRRTLADSEIAEEAGVEPTEDACAPSNGFEARAPHRERYSSVLILLGFAERVICHFLRFCHFCRTRPRDVRAPFPAGAPLPPPRVSDVRRHCNAAMRAC